MTLLLLVCASGPAHEAARCSLAGAAEKSADEYALKQNLLARGYRASLWRHGSSPPPALCVPGNTLVAQMKRIRALCAFAFVPTGAQSTDVRPGPPPTPEPSRPFLS
eukprot:scaffold16426_cov109-Isochrysis_galbana.AAC.1